MSLHGQDSALPPGESARAPIASPDYLSETERRPVAAWLRALRLHHWSKNLFVFVPLLLGHLYDDLAKVAASVAAFLLLGLLVSAGYLINDVADVEADRQHKSKRHRPFASGRISPRAGIAAAAVLAAVAFAGAAFVARGLATVLIAYFLLTVGYSLWLKTVALVDVAAYKNADALVHVLRAFDDPAVPARAAGMESRFNIPIFSGVGQFRLYILAFEKQRLCAPTH